MHQPIIIIAVITDGKRFRAVIHGNPAYDTPTFLPGSYLVRTYRTILSSPTCIYRQTQPQGNAQSRHVKYSY